MISLIYMEVKHPEEEEGSNTETSVYLYRD